MARASALLLRPGPSPATTAWRVPEWDVPGPDELPALRLRTEASRHRASGRSGSPTPGVLERRAEAGVVPDNRPLVAGEPLTPLVRAALSADLPNPLANAGAEGLSFINADLTLFLARRPSSDWIGLEVADHLAADGLAIGTCTLYDLDGPMAGRACARSPTR